MLKNRKDSSIPRYQISTEVHFTMTVEDDEYIEHVMKSHRENVEGFLKYAMNTHNQDSKCVALLGKVENLVGGIGIDTTALWDLDSNENPVKTVI
jgi:hypothetical protein